MTEVLSAYEQSAKIMDNGSRMKASIQGAVETGRDYESRVNCSLAISYIFSIGFCGD